MRPGTNNASFSCLTLISATASSIIKGSPSHREIISPARKAPGRQRVVHVQCGAFLHHIPAALVGAAHHQKGGKGEKDCLRSLPNCPNLTTHPPQKPQTPPQPSLNPPTWRTRPWPKG